MDRRSKLVAAAVLLLCASANAGYALPAPPAGFGGSPGSWTFTPPANAPTIGGGAPASNAPLWRGPGPTLPAAGGGVPTSAAFRMGAGGGRALAGAALRLAIPGVGLALGIAWLASYCYERQGGMWVRTCGGTPLPQSDGYEYRVNSGGWYPTATQACQSMPNDSLFRWEFQSVQTFGAGSALCHYTKYRVSNGTVADADAQVSAQSRVAGSCPAGWYVTPAGCMASPPPQTVTEQEILDDMATKPLPNPLPLGVPYPLDPVAPIIFEPTPGDNPQGQPVRVPQGNPVPIPNTNPQQYRQPVTRWSHSPTPTEPWRMSAEPQDVIGTDPQGMTEPQPETSGSPSGGTPEKSDLCADHPDIIACQVFKPDDLTEKPLVNKEVPLALNAEGGFPSGGSCPQPKSVQLMGKTFAFSMQPLCDFALGIKPLLIGFAWLSAALVFLGVARREN